MPPRSFTAEGIAGFALAFLLVLSGAACGDEDAAFGGSFRSVAAVSDNYDFAPFFGPGNELDGTTQSILRLTAGGRAGRYAYEIHAVEAAQILTFEGGGSGFFAPADAGMRYRAVRDYWDQRSTGDFSAGFWVDRLNAKMSAGGLDVTLGRQAVTFGKAYFWNPLDVFMAFDPRQFDREYKSGVDGLKADYTLGAFSGLNLVAVAGRKRDTSGRYGGGEALDMDWEGCALLARVFWTASGWDWALQGGKVYGGYQAGLGWAGEIEGVGVRGEAAEFMEDSSGDIRSLSGSPVGLKNGFTAVAGLGRRFESSLDLEAEYFFNGLARSSRLDSAALFESGDILQMGRHFFGLTALYEFMPLLTGRLTGVCSFSDGSAFVQPALVYSVGNEAEFLAGASLNFGERPRISDDGTIVMESEFGAYPDYYYAEYKFYF